MADPMMPDLSHLTEEERKIIEEVLQRQKAEENKEQQVQQQYEKELEEVDRQINERKETAMRLVGTQDDAICQICQKTKFADGIGHKCYYCQLRSCARCGGRTQIKAKTDQVRTPAGQPSKSQPQKTIWACALCQKRQQILGKTGKWFHKDGGVTGSGSRATTPTGLSPTGTPTPTTSFAPVSSSTPSQRPTSSGMQPNGAPGSMGANKQQPFTLQQPQPPSQQQQQQQRTSSGQQGPSHNQSSIDRERDRQQQNRRERPPSPQSSPSPYQEQRPLHERQPSNHQPAPRSRQSSDRRSSLEDRRDRSDQRRDEYSRSGSPGPSSSFDRQTSADRERRRSSRQQPPPSSAPVTEETNGKRRPSNDRRLSGDCAPTPPSLSSVDREHDRRRQRSREQWPPPSSDQQRSDSREFYDDNNPAPSGQTMPIDYRRPLDARVSPTSTRTEDREARRSSRSPTLPATISPSGSRRGEYRAGELRYEEERPLSPSYERPKTPTDLPTVRLASRDRQDQVDRTGRDRDRELESGYASRGEGDTRNAEERRVRRSGATGDYTYDNGARRSTSRGRYEYDYEQREPRARTPPPQPQQTVVRRESGERRSPSYRREEYAEERYDDMQRPMPAPSEKPVRSRESSRSTRKSPSDQFRAPADVYSARSARTPPPEEEYGYYDQRKAPRVASTYAEEIPRTVSAPATRSSHRREQPEPRAQERRRLPEPEEILRAGAAASAPPPPASRPVVRQSPHTRHRQLDTSNSAYRQDSLSSDAESMHRPGPAGGFIRVSPTNSHYQHQQQQQHHHSKSHYGSAAHGRHAHAPRSARVSHHKQRSFSSSDDEVASTSECPSCEELESEAYSDRGANRYSSREKLGPRFGAAAVVPGMAVVDTIDAQLLAGGRQLSVTWQPSADGQRMIGHMILRRPSGASLGLKVVGGRPTSSGRLGAFVTKVKRGSVAEVVGHLKPGDEVLEWNGRELQNASFDEVCDIINESKHDPQVELIVSRPIAGVANDYGVKSAPMRYVGGMAGTGSLAHELQIDLSDQEDSQCEIPLDEDNTDPTEEELEPEEADYGSRSSCRSSRRDSHGAVSVWTRTSAATSETRIGACESLKAFLARAHRTFVFCSLCCPSVMQDEPNDIVSRADAFSLQKQMPPTGGVITMQPMATGAPPNAIHPGQTPVVMITAPALSPAEPVVMMPSSAGSVLRTNALTQQQAKGQIFGRIQIALVYSPADQQLVITVYQAVDLPPRNDGSVRNPYVKMFLLPDRSEKSRRQSKTLAGTCQPTWQQSFIYQSVTQMDLAIRVLEVTLWDYDKYATNEFLGEVLFDLASSLLDNEPRWYTLTDMDEESPVRLKLRHLRLNTYANQQTTDARALTDQSNVYGSSYPGAGAVLHAGTDPLGEDLQRYRSGSGRAVAFLDQQNSGITRSQTYHRTRHPELADQEQTAEEMYSGYYSDHGHQSRAVRRPARAAAAPGPKTSDAGEGYELEGPGENTVEGELVYDRDGNVVGESQRHLPRVPADIYGEEAMRELGDKAQQMRNQVAGQRRHHSARSHRNMHAGVVANLHRRHLQRLPYDPTSPPNDHTLPGYLSDGSETSMSITSTQSERPRTTTHREYQNSLEAAPEETEPYDNQDGTMSDSAVGAGSGGPSNKSPGMVVDAKRKKSIMTRLIPGRAVSASVLADQKRMGFRRSDEVGVPANLSPLSGSGEYLVKQTSRESTDSNDSSWLPIVPGDGPLGEFIAGLGQGQVVGRQALASPCLGEIQLVISHKSGILEVKVTRARNLVKKPGAKYNPAPYVKVYLMEGKYCIAKAKTGVAARTAEPRFDQKLVFNETYRGRLLQISVWGDYGRMERKIFMGIALVRLDALEQTPRLEGWYKLYHSSSLVGTSSPARKESMGVDQVAETTGGASYAAVQNSTSALSRST